MKLLLSPHNDDAELFASYTCLRERPLVVVCTRSFVEESWDPPVYYQTREAETAAACAVLGCEYVQLEHPDVEKPWGSVMTSLRRWSPDEVFAPLPEEKNGHPHHDAIGRLAEYLWPGRVRYYATYTTSGKTVTRGARVFPEPGWEELKLDALACYESQRTHPNTQRAFTEWPLDEYLT